MFSNSFQSGFISIFYSVGSNPLSIWEKEVKNGHIRRVIDEQVKSLVLEIGGTNVATTFITCPIQPRASLGIKLPFLVMIIKNMKKYFTFEIQILDDKNTRRRFRVSNFQSTTKVRPFCTTMPIGLSAGWNQIHFNLADFTKRAYGSTYLETVRVQIHANVRIRRIYFSDTLYSEEELPNDYRLYIPSSTGVPTEKKRPSGQKEPKGKGKGKKEPVEKLKVPTGEDTDLPSGALPTPVAPEDRPKTPEEAEAASKKSSVSKVEGGEVDSTGKPKVVAEENVPLDGTYLVEKPQSVQEGSANASEGPVIPDIVITPPPEDLPIPEIVITPPPEDLPIPDIVITPPPDEGTSEKASDKTSVKTAEGGEPANAMDFLSVPIEPPPDDDGGPDHGGEEDTPFAPTAAHDTTAFISPEVLDDALPMIVELPDDGSPADVTYADNVVVEAPDETVIEDRANTSDGAVKPHGVEIEEID